MWMNVNGYSARMEETVWTLEDRTTVCALQDSEECSVIFQVAQHIHNLYLKSHRKWIKICRWDLTNHLLVQKCTERSYWIPINSGVQRKRISSENVSLHDFDMTVQMRLEYTQQFFLSGQHSKTAKSKLAPKFAPSWGEPLLTL